MERTGKCLSEPTKNKRGQWSNRPKNGEGKYNHSDEQKVPWQSPAAYNVAARNRIKIVLELLVSSKHQPNK